MAVKLLFIPSRGTATVLDWVHLADQDYVSARALFLLDSPLFWLSAAVLGQQAVEKYLKAIFVSHGRRSPGGKRGHGVEGMARQIMFTFKARKPPLFPERFFANLKRFETYYKKLRYPDSKLNHQLTIGRELMEVLDYIIWKVRPQVNYERENLPDSFEGMYRGHNMFLRAFVETAKQKNKYWGQF